MIFYYLRKSEARNKTGLPQNDATQSHTYYLVSPPLKDLLVSAHLLIIILRYLNFKYTIIQAVSYWYYCYTQEHCHTVTTNQSDLPLTVRLAQESSTLTFHLMKLLHQGSL